MFETSAANLPLLSARKIDCGRVRTKMPTYPRRASKALNGRARALKMHGAIRLIGKCIDAYQRRGGGSPRP
jgi:hypothetical protein